MSSIPLQTTSSSVPVSNEDPLQVVSHRPYPLPRGPWLMQQNWHDILFMHWPLDPQLLFPCLPAILRPHLDYYAGTPWVGVIPFWMSGVRPRWLPPLPGLSQFSELNVRTYLTIDGKPGVYFFSLDANNLPAVWAARLGFGLPYLHARMKTKKTADRIVYRSERRSPAVGAQFVGEYGPANEVFKATPGTLDYFLIERYCLFVPAGRTIMRGDIHHKPWPLQAAWCRTTANSVAQADGIRLPTVEPVLHYARDLSVFFWPPKREQEN